MYGSLPELTPSPAKTNRPLKFTIAPEWICSLLLKLGNHQSATTLAICTIKLKKTTRISGGEI